MSALEPLGDDDGLTDIERRVGFASDAWSYPEPEEGVGHPTALITDLWLRMLILVREGHSISGAAILCDLNPATITLWKDRVAAYKARLEDPDTPALPDAREERYLRFLNEIEKVKQVRRAALLHEIEEAGRGHRVVTRKTTTKVLANGDTEIIEEERESFERAWQANAWLLERQMPEEFAQVRRMEHTGRDGEPISVRSAQRVELDPSDRWDKVAQMAAVLTEIGALPMPYEDQHEGGEDGDRSEGPLPVESSVVDIDRDGRDDI